MSSELNSSLLPIVAIGAYCSLLGPGLFIISIKLRKLQTSNPAKSVAQAQPGQTKNNCIVIDDDDAESDEAPRAKRARTDAPTM